MENLSLDIEPPSKKEVNKKKNGTLPQLIVFLRNDKNKSQNIAKNLEKEVISNWQKNILDVGYLKNEEGYIENNLTLTNNIPAFANPNITSNQAILESHYTQKGDNIEFTRKDLSKIYEITPSYSFIPQIKEENKKEDLSAQSKEQEAKEKEVQYALHNFDEETAQEN